MIRYRALAVVLAACLLVAISGTRHLYASRSQGDVPTEPIAIADLVMRTRDLDETEVRIIGEAVGDLMFRGDHAWVNVLDASGTAIGVFMSRDQALKIRDLGKYLHKGDVLDLTGVFHNSCDVHDGEPDIHASTLSVVEQGHPLVSLVDTSRIAVGGLLLVTSAVMGAAVRRRTSHVAR